MREVLSTEAIEAKRLELEAKHGKKVYPLDLKDGKGDQAIGFCLEAERITKMRVLDVAAMKESPTEAGALLLNATLIKEESDPRILSDSPEHDEIHIGAVMACMERVGFWQNQFKKK